MHSNAIGLLTALALPAVAGADVIADSVAEYSSLQGQNNWHYGYWAANGSEYAADEFQPFANFIEDGRWVIDLGEGGYYTEMHALGQHPNGEITSWGRQSVEHWAVRRWESEVQGIVEIEGTIADIRLSEWNNGVSARIYVDGTEIWSELVPQNLVGGLQYSVQADVLRGSVVDFVIDPIDSNDRSDGTIFTSQISVVPAPAGALALIGGCGLLGLRRR